MYKEAINAVSMHDYARGRDLFTRLLRINAHNADYWLWMSACVETSKERLYCLREAHKLAPNHPAVLRGLRMLGEAPPASTPDFPYEQQIRKWSAPKLQKNLPETGLPGKKLWLRVAAGAGALLIVAALLLVGLLGPENSPLSFLFAPRPTPTLRRVPTLTPQTPSPTAPLSTAPAGQPTPLAALLGATYTPTPLYVNTPHSVSEAYRTGLRAMQRQEWDAARGYFSQVATLEPTALDLPYLSAETYRLSGELEAAVLEYEKIIAANPEFAPAYLGRARAWLAEQTPDLDKAGRDLQRAVALDAAMFESYLELARLEQLRGDPQASLDWLNTLEAYSPANPQAMQLRARAHLALGEAADAVDWARQASQADLTSLPGYLLLGEALLKAGEAEQAISPLETYTLHAAQQPEGWVLLARAYQLSGRQADALAALTRLEAGDGSDFDLLVQRGLLYLELEQPEKAVEDLERARAINKKTFAANIALGRAYLAVDRAGNAYQALSEAEAFANSDADQAEVYYWRAQSLDELGEVKVALREWRALLALPQDAVPDEWRAAAEERIAQTITPTPTRLTPTPTQTRWPSATLRP